MSLNRPSATGNLLSVPEEKTLKTIEYPVVGKDNDGLLITMSINKYHSLPKEAFEEINTYNPTGYNKMVDNLLTLLLYLSPKDLIPSIPENNENQINDKPKKINIKDAIREDIENNYGIDH